MTLADPIGPAAPVSPGISPFARMVRIFVRPDSAWIGLGERGQWWVPLLVPILISLVCSSLTYQRAHLPTIREGMQKAIDMGQMQPDQAEYIMRFWGSPPGVAVILGSIAVVMPVLALGQALILWFGAGFVLGAKFRFSNAFAVVIWSSLVRLPATLISYGYGWVQRSFEGLHLGLGVLLPEPETPNKLHTGLTVFLDGISPFAAWYLVVVVLGTAALSGAPRRNIAWVLVTLYLALVAFSAAVAGLFSPGS